MNKIVKIIVVIIIVDVIIFGGYFGYKLFFSGKSEHVEEDYEWVTIDEYYTPKDFVEEFIKNESAAQDLFPVSIKNYGSNKKILRKFSGSKFARPTEAHIKMMFSKMEDWKIIELKYTSKRVREVIRTVLYIFVDNAWTVADSGRLMKK